MPTTRSPLSTLNPQRSTSSRLAIVLSHPTQYYSPWFRWLAAHTSLEVRVFYLWDFGVTENLDPNFQANFKWDVDLLSGYAHEFVPNVSRDPGTHHFQGLRNPTLTRRLAAWRPDALLMFGYKWNAHLRALLWARRRGVPVLFRGDSHFLGRGAPGVLARTALRGLYAQFRAALYVGAANRDYFATLGLRDEKLFFAPHAVNHELFDPDLPAHQAAAKALRTELGIAPTTRVVMFAGKFVPAKQPRELITAFLAQRRPDAALVLVGDGPEKPALLELARAAPAGAVHFLPFANQSEMPGRLLAADVFALPSRGYYETWGLALNEAMHMGVPCLVSDLVGCQRDLVQRGRTGWVFSAEEPSGLRHALQSALDCPPANLKVMAKNARALVSGYTYSQSTAGLLAALEKCHGQLTTDH